MDINACNSYDAYQLQMGLNYQFRRTVEPSMKAFAVIRRPNDKEEDGSRLG